MKMKMSNAFVIMGVVLLLVSLAVVNGVYYANDALTWEVATWSAASVIGLMGTAFLIVGGIWIGDDV